MAFFDSIDAIEEFNLGNPGLVAFSVPAASTATTYAWTTTDGYTVTLTGTDLTVDLLGTLEGGTVTSLTIGAGPGLTSDPGTLHVDGLLVDAASIFNPTLDGEGFSIAFWRAALGNNGLSTLDAALVPVFGGDGTIAGTSATLIGSGDRIIINGVPARAASALPEESFAQVYAGDFLSSFPGSQVVGGDDSLTLSLFGEGGASQILVSGDVGEAEGSLVGGDDVLRIRGDRAALAVGEQVIDATGQSVNGGDDRIIGSGAGDLLFGDVLLRAGSTPGQRFERFVLSGGDDVLEGRGGDDTLRGDLDIVLDGIEGLTFATRTTRDFLATIDPLYTGGNDTLLGGAGNDDLAGNEGSDTLDGGEGIDIARQEDVLMTGAEYVRVGDTLRIVQVTGDVDTLRNVETVIHSVGSTNAGLVPLNVDVASLPEFDGLTYAATYRDIALSLSGTAAELNAAGADHYVRLGFFEGRIMPGLTVPGSAPLEMDTIPFDAQQYVDNYADLAAAFGTGASLDAERAMLHFINVGAAEGRLGIDASAYLASHPDLIAAFGADEATAVRHYEAFGLNERRAIDFDPVQYLANYADLSAAFGTDLGAATRHYVVSGLAEGRTALDPLDVVASDADLITLYGDFGNAPDVGMRWLADVAANPALLAGAEATFDAAQYLANYGDLGAAFGRDTEAAARHFITFGFYEGRTDADIFA